MAEPIVELHKHYGYNKITYRQIQQHERLTKKMIRNGRLWIAKRNKNKKGQRKRTHRMKKKMKD
jgi:hypothetical protein